MKFSFLLVFGLFVTLSLSAHLPGHPTQPPAPTPRTLTSTTRLINNPDVKFIDHIGGPSACADMFMYITSGSSWCANVANMDGSVNTSTCDPRLQGVTGLSCSDSWCFAVSPTNGYVLVLNPATGFVETTIGSSVLTMPTLVVAYEEDVTGDSGNVEIFVVDVTENNTIWLFVVDVVTLVTAPVTDTMIWTANDTAPILAIGLDELSNFYILNNGSADMAMYTYYAPLFGNPVTFQYNEQWTPDPRLSVVAFEKFLYVDRFKLYLYEAGCQCILAFILGSSNNYHILTIDSAAADAVYFGTSRDAYYIADSTGVLRVNDPFTLVSAVVHDLTCLTVTGNPPAGASIVFTAQGGAFPYVFSLWPEGSSGSSFTYGPTPSFTWSNLFPLAYPVYALYEWYMFHDTVALAFSTLTTHGKYSFDNTTYAPGGNASISLQFDSQSPTLKGTYEIYCNALPSCIDDRYRIMEFAINFGDGGQSIELSINSDAFTAILTEVYNASNYRPNHWYTIQIPLPQMALVDRIIFTDAEPTVANQNTFWIDDIKFIPTSDYARYGKIVDSCGSVINVDKPLNITLNNIFNVNVNVSTVTCNAAMTLNGMNSSDAVATSTVANGIGPFEYHWIFEDAGPDNTTIENLSAMVTYVTIYDNALNNSGHWVDTSSMDDRNMADTAQYHSAPYSISMTSPANADTLGISFTLHPPMPVNEFSVLTFWVHGGQYGGQRIKFVTYRYALSEENYDLSNLMGLPFIPANNWIQVNFTFGYGYSFTSFAFQVDGNDPQPTIYIDDITLVLTPTLRVNDLGTSNGCYATFPDLVIPTPAPIVVTAQPTNAMCYNSSDGALDLNVVGGVAPYTYKWNIPHNTAPVTAAPVLLDSLTESAITVDVTDANNCKVVTTRATILQPPPLSFAMDTKPIMCNAGKATITSSMVGGVTPYTFTWGSSASNLVLTPQANPAPIFTDTLASSFSMSANLKIQCLGTGSHLNLAYSPSHAGYCSLLASFSTATPSVSISTCPTCFPTSKFTSIGMWIYVNSAQDAQNLFITLYAAGTPVSSPVSLYSLGTVVAATWSQVFYNTSSASTDPDQIVISSISPTTTNSLLIDDIVMIPAVVSSVGVSVYSGFHSIVSGGAGLYFLTIVDANGCSFTNKLTITEPTAIHVDSAIKTATDSTATDGEIALNVTGGTPPYTYLWQSSNSTTSTVSGLGSGEYVVVVSDANGCTSEVQLFVSVEARLEIRKYNKGLASGLGAVTAVAVVIALFAMAMLFIFWNSHTKLGTFYSFVVTVGVLVSYAAVFTLLPRPTDRLCTAFPWLLGIAFTLVYGCLFLKTWALYRVWIKAIQYQRATLTTFDIVRSVALALIVEIILLAIWTAVDPPKAELVKVVGNTWEMQCTTDHPTFWIIFVAMKGVWLLFGAILSVLTRNVMKEYNESASIAYAIYNILVLLVIAIPLAALLDVVPGGRLVIEVVVPVLAFTSTLVIMFFKIWHAALFSTNEVKLPGMRVTNAGNTNTTYYSGGTGGSGGSNNSANSKGSKEMSSDSPRESAASRSAAGNI